MFLYLLLSLFVCILFIFSRHSKNNNIVNFSLLLQWFISAFRFDVGYDFVSYYLMGTQDVTYQAYLFRFEPANVLIYIITWFFNFPQLSIIIYSTVSTILLKLILNKLDNSYFAFLIYFAFPTLFLNSLSLLRQNIALLLCFYSLFFIGRSNVKYIIIVLFSMFFHYSSLIFIIASLAVFNFPTLLSITMNILLLLSIIFTNGFKFVIDLVPWYNNYVESASGANGGGFIRVIANIIAFFLLFSVMTKKSFIKKVSILFIIGVVLFNLFYPYGASGIRIFVLFSPILMLVIPHMTSKFKPQDLFQNFVVFTLVIVFNGYVYTTTLNPIKTPLTPYQNYLFQDEYKFK